jgi:hypothetical protein
VQAAIAATPELAQYGDVILGCIEVGYRERDRQLSYHRERERKVSEKKSTFVRSVFLNVSGDTVAVPAHVNMLLMIPPRPAPFLKIDFERRGRTRGGRGRRTRSS